MTGLTAAQVASRSEGGVALAVLVVVLTQAVFLLGVGLTEARAGCAHDGGEGKVGLLLC